MMSFLELKIPPVAQALLIALMMWLLAISTPAFALAVAAKSLVCGTLLVAGAVVGLSGVVAFRRAQTTVNPLVPDSASALVTCGVYRITRNPMYLGLLLWLVAWGIWLSNLFALLCLPLYVAYMHRFQILPEERALQISFGEAYLTYQRQVRRWL